jgi:hypothetical protein
MKLAVALGLLAGTAQAATVETLKTYAAFAKIEANVVEAAKNVAVAAAMPGDNPVSEEAAEEYAEDVEAIAFYVAELRKLPLSADDAAALDFFEADWAAFEAEGRAIIEDATDGAILGSRLTAWWEKVEALDELTDARLSAILAAEGAAFEDAP